MCEEHTDQYHDYQLQCKLIQLVAACLILICLRVVVYRSDRSLRLLQSALLFNFQRKLGADQTPNVLYAASVQRPHMSLYHVPCVLGAVTLINVLNTNTCRNIISLPFDLQTMILFKYLINHVATQTFGFLSNVNYALQNVSAHNPFVYTRNEETDKIVCKNLQHGSHNKIYKQNIVKTMDYTMVSNGQTIQGRSRPNTSFRNDLQTVQQTF